MCSVVSQLYKYVYTYIKSNPSYLLFKALFAIEIAQKKNCGFESISGGISVAYARVLFRSCRSKFRSTSYIYIAYEKESLPTYKHRASACLTMRIM